MLKIICDRCEAEIDSQKNGDWGIRLIPEKITGKIEELCLYPMDLCKKCVEDFKKFIKK